MVQRGIPWGLPITPGGRFTWTSLVRPYGSPFSWASSKLTVTSAWAPAWVVESEADTDSTAYFSNSAAEAEAVRAANAASDASRATT